MGGGFAVTTAIVTGTGLEIDTLIEVRDAITADLKTIYGSDINLDAATPDGQWIGVISNAIYQQAAALQTVSNSIDVRLAQGNALSGRVALNGLRRKAGTYATATFALAGIAGTVIAAGMQIQTDNGPIWSLTTAVTLPAAGAPVTGVFRCTTLGANSLSGGSTLRVLTPIYGLQTVTAPALATPGTPYETDTALQLRRSQGVALPSQTRVESMLTRVLAVEGVTAAAVYSNPNDTPLMVGTTSVAAHGAFVVVYGPSSDGANIATAIALTNSIGTPTTGSDLWPVVDSQGFSQPVRFSYAVETPIAFAMTTKRGAGWPGDVAGKEAIFAAVAQYFENTLVDKAITRPVTIGAAISVTQIEAAAACAGGHVVQSIFVTNDGGGTLAPSGELAIAADALGVFDLANSTITVIP